MAVRPVTGRGPMGVRSTPAHRRRDRASVMAREDRLAEQALAEKRGEDVFIKEPARREPRTAESFGGPPDTQRNLSPEEQQFLDQYNFQQAELDAHEAAGLAPSREGQVGGGPLQGISDVYTPMREYQLPDWLPPELQFIKDMALPVDSAELGMAGLFGGRIPFPGLPKAVATPVTAVAKNVKPWLQTLSHLITGGGEAAAKGDDLADIAKLAMEERPMNPKVTTEDLTPRDQPILSMDPKVKPVPPRWAESGAGATPDDVMQGGVFYHSSVSEALEVGAASAQGRPFHVGTLGAASDRAEALSHAYGTDPSTRFIHEFVVTPRKPYLPDGQIMTEMGSEGLNNLMAGHRWSEWYGLPLPRPGDTSMRLSEIKAAGYDVIPYINDVEDAGSISYYILDDSAISATGAVTSGTSGAADAATDVVARIEGD